MSSAIDPLNNWGEIYETVGWDHSLCQWQAFSHTDTLCNLNRPLLYYVHQNTGSCFVFIKHSVPKGHPLFLQWFLFCFVVFRISFPWASLIVRTVFMGCGRGEGGDGAFTLLTPVRKLRALLSNKNSLQLKMAKPMGRGGCHPSYSLISLKLLISCLTNYTHNLKHFKPGHHFGTVVKLLHITAHEIWDNFVVMRSSGIYAKYH